MPEPVLGTAPACSWKEAGWEHPSPTRVSSGRGGRTVMTSPAGVGGFLEEVGVRGEH